MIHFIFDVDGTLTPIGLAIDTDFKSFFSNWITIQKHKGNEVFIVTGSEKERTINQIGSDLYNHVHGVYQNSGNQLFVKGSLVKQSNWKMSSETKLEILEILKQSPWYRADCNNVEERMGSVYVSPIGKPAPEDLRNKYYEWDKVSNERKSIVKQICNKYTDLDFSIGGKVGIDIYPKGKDKSQVIQDMKEPDNVVFFGDRCSLGGNDYGIYSKAKRGHTVKDWKETWSIIKQRYVTFIINDPIIL